MLSSQAMHRKLFLFLILLVLSLAGCSSSRPAVPLVPVTGKATLHKEPAAGIQVAAYPVDVLSLSGSAPFVSSPTAADGCFRLELPAGEYYFLARGGGLFAFYGRNPVVVPAEGLTEMNLGLVFGGGVAEEGEPSVATGVAGRVLLGDTPLSGATVYVYTDLTSRFKGLGYLMAGPTDEAGFFEAQLPAGTYYLLARKRRGADGTGPLRAGDFIGYYPGNPLTVREGEAARIVLPVLEVPEKVEAMAASLFGRSGIQGRILDREGRPVPGARAVLYADPRMLDRPLFVSRPTGEDGAYVLSFPHGGTYFLAARNTLGGAPGPGELYGTYDATADHSLRLETGEVRQGIDIVVEEMW